MVARMSRRDERPDVVGPSSPRARPAHRLSAGEFPAARWGRLRERVRDDVERSASVEVIDEEEAAVLELEDPECFDFSHEFSLLEYLML